MSFKPKISLSDSDIREDESISFIENTLKGHGVKTQIDKRDKGANIDGYIELLDSQNRLTGKVTVQVKTVPPVKEGMYEFACPTSLFAYAERTAEVVLLLAVDHKSQIVLWKHINTDLIESNRSKEDQGHITLHFGIDETISSANVDQVIKTWRQIVDEQVKRYVSAPSFQQELHEVKEYILKCQSLPVNIKPEELSVLQSFLDDFNKVMKTELSFIKDFFYPNVWKFGVAFSDFSDNSVCYATYPIMKGEQLSEIRRLPSNYLWSIRSMSIYGHNNSNPFLKNYKLIIKEQVKQHIDSYLNHIQIPANDAFAVETILSAFRKDSKYSVFSNQNRKSFSKLIDWIEHNYPDANDKNIVLHSGFDKYPLTDIYKALILLKNKGVEQLVEPYAPKGTYGSTGYIYDWYNADIAFVKMKYVIEKVTDAYEIFVKDNFPCFADSLLMENDCDVIIYNLHYNTSDSKDPGIEIYYLISENMYKKEKKIIFSKNSDDELCQEVEKYNIFDLYREGFSFKGRQYKLKSQVSTIAHEILFSEIPIWETYTKLLRERLSMIPDLITI